MIVTIQPPAYIRRKLHVEGGLSVASQHITLCYIDNDYQKDQKTVMDIAASVIETCNSLKPFNCTVSHLDRFQNVKRVVDSEGNTSDAEEPTDVIFAEVVGDGLHSFRHSLVYKMEQYGVPYSKIHKEFKGHISLIYVPHGKEIESVPELPQEFECNEIQIWGKGSEVLFSYQIKG